MSPSLNPPRRVRMLFFDAAGTLLHLPRGVGAHYAEVAARHGLALPPPPLEAAFRRAFREIPAPATTRQPRPDDDRGRWRAIVWQVLEQCGAPADFAREPFFEELYGAFAQPGVWALYPEAREVLKTLQPLYRLGIISNFDGRLRAVLGHLGIAEFFETVTISSEVGADKPDPWIFESALRQAGVSASEAAYLGDDEECDWRAARAAGFASFELNRPYNSLCDVLPWLEELEVTSRPTPGAPPAPSSAGS